MLINLWSTPRTGGVRYSFSLRKDNPGSVLMSEMFNRYHMTLYYKEVNGRLHNFQQYTEGAFYKNFHLSDGKLLVENKYGIRPRNLEQQEQYLIDIFNKIDGTQTIIMHNHAAPINREIRDHLTNIADANHYIHRYDKRKQLASYAIAYSTKQFIAFSKAEVTSGVVADIDPNVLSNLMNRIVEWDRMEKRGKVVAYEDLQFEDIERFPVKQNTDHYSRLSNRMIDVIEDLVYKYENNQL